MFERAARIYADRPGDQGGRDIEQTDRIRVDGVRRTLRVERSTSWRELPRARGCDRLIPEGENKPGVCAAEKTEIDARIFDFSDRVRSDDDDFGKR